MNTLTDDQPGVAPIDLLYPDCWVPQQAPDLFGTHFALNLVSHDTVEHAGIDQTISTIPTSVPTQLRKKKAPTLSADAWKPYKARIIELHVTQGLSLKEVRKIIEDDFGFTAE